MDSKTITLDQERNDVVKFLKKLPNGDPKRGHKFVYTNDRKFIISTTGKGKPKHGKLGADYDVNDIKTGGTAGWVKFIFDSNSQEIKVNFYNRSLHYCPSYDSLKKAEGFIKEILGSVKVKLIDDPNPKCNQKK